MLCGYASQGISVDYSPTRDCGLSEEAERPEPAKDNYMKEDRVVEKALVVWRHLKTVCVEHLSKARDQCSGGFRNPSEQNR